MVHTRTYSSLRDFVDFDAGRLSMSVPTLMVLDGESRITLGIVRRLGRKRIPIIVGSDFPLGKTEFSRYVQDRFDYDLKGDGLLTAHLRILEKVQSLRQ